MAETPTGEKSQMAAVSSQDDVYWEGDEDPLNPMNWSSRLKWAHILLVSVLTFVVSLASSMLAPVIPQITSSLGSQDPTLDSFTLSAYVIGFTLGPLFVAPLSEIYGRSLVYQISNILYIAFSVGCALSTNISTFIAFRLLSGCVGVTPLTLGPCSIGDIMPLESMGRPIAIWGLGSLVAPVLAPIAGGYLTEAAGWPWIFWVIIICVGVIVLLSPFILRETYAPVILARKAKQLGAESGNPDLRSRLDKGVPTYRLIRSAFCRPLKLLCISPVVSLLAIYAAVVYGYQYLIFATLSFIYQSQYHFGPGKSGLIYLGTGIGTVLAVIILGHFLDLVSNRDKQAGKATQPERCLWPLFIGAFLVPISLFWYGWSLQANSHPVVPLVGLGVFGFGMMAIFMPMPIYFVGVYSVHSASAVAAGNVLRNVVGALLPLGGQGLYDALGSGWGNSLLGFIAVAFIPIPFILTYYGKTLRSCDRNLKSTADDTPSQSTTS